jgi:micrococcal nuclease
LTLPCISLATGKKVKYNGIEVPGIHHPTRIPEKSGQEALKVNREMVEDKEIRLEYDQTKKDRYGRLLVYVFAGDTFVNAELIKQGYARIATSRSNRKYHELFLRLQKEARDNDRGLWRGCGDKSSK